MAASVGKSRTAITNSLRLLKLEARVQQLLITGQLSEGHGKILASLAPHQQLDLAERCVQRNWNVRQMESEAKKLQPTCSTQQTLYSDVNIKHLETALSEHIGNRVQLEYEQKGGGYLRIRFNNIDELEGHLERIGFQTEEASNTQSQ